MEKIDIPQGLQRFPVDEYLFGEDKVCGLRFQISPYGSDDPEYEICGDPAVACSLDDDERPGRCNEHLPNFEYLNHWGYVPAPAEVIQLLDRPRPFAYEHFDA